VVTETGRLEFVVTSAGGGFVQAGGTSAITGNASDAAILVRVFGSGDVVVATLRTGTDPSEVGGIGDKPPGQVTIETGGAILATTPGGEDNLVTERVVLEAGTGIGAVHEPLRTDIEFLTAYTQTGVIRVLERDGLQLEGIAAPGEFVGSAPQVEIVSQTGPLVILNGTFLESSTGRVSNVPTVLQLVQDDPDDVLVSGDPTQEIRGTLGGVEGLGDNLELGINFRLSVRWDDGVISELDTPPTSIVTEVGDGWVTLVGVTPTLQAGDQIVWLIDQNNQGTVSIIRAAEPRGPIEVFVQRTYPLFHLQRLREPEVTATFQAFNDRNLVLSVLDAPPGTSLNSSVTISITTRVAEELILLTVAGKVIEPEVVTVEPKTVFVVDTIPTLPGQVVFYNESIGDEEFDEEAVARLYLLRILPGGEVGERAMLSLAELRDLSNLLERLKNSPIPNGSYRIEYQEPGLPAQVVLEFRKTGDVIGDPVRERGVGSNPAEEGNLNDADEPSPAVEDGAAVPGWGMETPGRGGREGIGRGGDEVRGDETVAWASWSRAARQVRKWAAVDAADSSGG